MGLLKRPARRDRDDCCKFEMTFVNLLIRRLDLLILEMPQKHSVLLTKMRTSETIETIPNGK